MARTKTKERRSRNVTPRSIGNDNLCPTCASAPRANPGRECGACGSWVCAHTSVEERGRTTCLPCRNGTDCGCGAGGGCACLFGFGECRCEPAARRNSGPRSGRPALREIERRAERLAKVRRNSPGRHREIVAELEAMSRGMDPNGRRETEFPGWSDGDFEELLVLADRRR